MKTTQYALTCSAFGLALCASCAATGEIPRPAPLPLSVTSEAFIDGATIPDPNSARGGNRSPALSLMSIAEGAKTVAIVMEDLDTPIGIITHWLMWDIPIESIRDAGDGSRATIPQGIAEGDSVPSLGGATQGRNIWFRHAYYGPEPVRRTGTHRYRISVFVLDDALGLPASAGKKRLLRAIGEHAIQTGTLTGTKRHPKETER